VDLSIIIVNWNTREHLRACLASLRSAGASLTCETLVIDNASIDGSAAMVREEFPEVCLVANSRNLGYAAGNNQGLRLAQGEFSLLLNADTEVGREALEGLVEFLRRRPEAGAAAPRLVHRDGRIQESVRAFPSPGALLGDIAGAARDAYRTPVTSVTEPMQVDQPMASCLLLRRAALDQIGPMDEQFPIFFNDVDLCYRLKRAGWEIWYLPGLRVLHHGGASTRQVRPEMIRESHRSLHRYYAKHYRERMATPLYALIVAAIYLAGAARYALAVVRRSAKGA
jgi:GT2 family glycosyltransferase